MHACRWSRPPRTRCSASTIHWSERCAPTRPRSTSCSCWPWSRRPEPVCWRGRDPLGLVVILAAGAVQLTTALRLIVLRERVHDESLSSSSSKTTGRSSWRRSSASVAASPTSATALPLPIRSSGSPRQRRARSQVLQSRTSTSSWSGISKPSFVRSRCSCGPKRRMSLASPCMERLVSGSGSLLYCGPERALREELSLVRYRLLAAGRSDPVGSESPQRMCPEPS